MALDRYELYATLVHKDAQTPWFAARALPPKPEVGFADLIRERSRDLFGGEPGRQASSPSTSINEPKGPGPGKKARRS
jgi:hypothetical protein